MTHLLDERLFSHMRLDGDVLTSFLIYYGPALSDEEALTIKKALIKAAHK